jgi:hybrid cluster-associated redox disulfide protein
MKNAVLFAPAQKPEVSTDQAHPMASERHRLHEDSVVDEIMRTFPTTIRVFLDFHMNCVGCSIAPFHTIRDSCRAHDIETEAFMTALQKAGAG